MEERNQYNGIIDYTSQSGNMIRDIRKKNNMSREKMAYGICSVRKYARIETGQEQPTEAEFINLVNRLGEPSLYYSDLYSNGKYECLALRAQIREEALLDNWEKACEYMCSYSQLFPPYNPEEHQFLGFYETIYCYMMNDDMDGLMLAEMCNDLMKLSSHDFRSLTDSSYIPTQSEFLIMNAIAVGLSEHADSMLYQRSRAILLSLLMMNKKRSLPSLCRLTRIGLLLNLCIIETENEDYYAAEEHLRGLFHNIRYTGGSYLYIRALNCQADLFERTGRSIESSNIRHSIQTLFHMNSEKSHNKVLVF